MSKTAVRKVLAAMERSQLQELLLQLYDARREAKEFLDFYADPNPAALAESYRLQIEKELAKRGRRRAKPSITAVRKLVKYYASLEPGAQEVLDLMIFTQKKIANLMLTVWLSESQIKSLGNYLQDVLKYADINGLWPRMLDAMLPLQKAMAQAPYADARALGEHWLAIMQAYRPVSLDK